MRRGTYALYNNVEYEVDIQGENIELVSHSKTDYEENNFERYIYPDILSNNHNLPDIYVKKIQADSLSKIYEITPFVKYKEMLFPVRTEEKERYLIGTPDVDLAKKI